MKNLTRIKKDFSRIKKLGFVECKRPNNKDGGVGNTYEDLLGIIENNNSNPDYVGFEIKSKKAYTKSYITLFSKIPTFPKRANSYLRETYGEYRDPNFPEKKKLYASVFGHRFTTVYNKYKMKLHVNEKKKIVELKIYNLDNKCIDIVHWDYNDLFIATSKINSLLLVIANTNLENKRRFYHYCEAEIYTEFDFNKFLENITIGNIQFDLRIGVYNSGKSIGKTHDHGSGFRIKKENFPNLYNKVQFIE